MEAAAREMDRKLELYKKMKKVKKEDSLLGDEEQLGDDEDFELIRQVEEEAEQMKDDGTY